MIKIIHINNYLKKNKIILSAGIIILIITMLISIPNYGYPLLDKNQRNVFEKIHDFFSFGYYFNVALIHKINGNIEGEKEMLAKAVWYKPSFIKEYSGTEKDFVTIAEKYEQLSIYNISSKIYTYLAKNSTNNIQYYFRAGANYQRINNWQKAKWAHENIIRLDNKNPYGYYYLGKDCLNLKDLTCSEENLKKSTKLKSDFADAYYQLGLLYLAQGRVDKSEILFKKTIEILPNHLDALLKLYEIKKN